MGLNIGGVVEKVNGHELSYSTFVEKYLSKNEPVVITGFMDDWRACRDWVFDDGRPNLQFISSNFGDSKVQVADCGSREFTEQKRFEMSVSEFIDQWLEFSLLEHGNHPPSKLKGKTLLYLKDWHFVKEYPEYTAYTTPLFFLDDWLNLYLDHYHMHEDPDTNQKRDDLRCSDYRFVYMGAKGTWTPFHADVFRSYSWSANVCGKKQWYFLSPGQRHLVFDRNMKSSVYDIFEEVSETIFPNFKKTIWLECTQDQNEIIFVPSGWFHQVHNLWDLLLGDYKEATEYIEDVKDICDDFEGLCQRNLAANTGMNFYDFFNFMVRFSFANILQLCHLAGSSAFAKWRSSCKAQHFIFNLESTKDIAIKMKFTCLSEIHNFSLDFRSILEEPAFLELCFQLERTGAFIHDQHAPIDNTKKYSMDDLVDLGFCNLFSTVVCNPEDLVILIDRTLQNLIILPWERSRMAGVNEIEFPASL
ncbi:jmjC domain-containing protein 4 isoform X2 [Cynara cardunculus var. scolymus]|uniref:jmjC domain-containing protein 4 isoform X2 n=1 Tax=Cynara cardunculus var. scolymus TaxID=59895 RepID=UPI000D62905B|nr:jmjC domain-containing protein 4 isoform X2 [Cynara cardunculus var. scolymus]